MGTQLPSYVTLDQAAQIAEQSVKTIRRRIADGSLPACRFGARNIRIKLEDLEAAARLIPNAVAPWLATNEAAPPTRRCLP